MFSIVSNRAIDLLLANEVANKIQFVGYKIGTLVDEAVENIQNEDLNYYTYFTKRLTDINYVEESFTQLYEASEESVSYIPLTSDKLILKCVTPPDTDTFFFNAVLVMAKYLDEVFIFSTQYYLVKNPKFNIEISKGGMYHYFLETLKLKDYETYFDLSNLTVRTATVDTYDTYLDLNRATHTKEDQAVLSEHLTENNNGAPHFLFDSEGQWFASPMQYIKFGEEAKDYVIGGHSVFSGTLPPLPEGFSFVLNPNNIPYVDEDGSFYIIEEA